MIERYFRTISRAIDVWAGLGGVSLLLLVLVTGIGVFFRYVLNVPINGLRDISQLLLLCCVSGAIPLAGKRGSHVAVDLLDVSLRPKLQRLLSIVVAAGCCALLATLLIAMLRQASCGFRCGQFTPDLAIPFWPMYVVLGIGFLLYLLQIAADQTGRE
jgi:TRAP-type C4-dicarboxylate transport system permease small subunit